MDYLQYDSYDDDFICPVMDNVLNLIINGLPSIPKGYDIGRMVVGISAVLNLIINGLPSIHTRKVARRYEALLF